MRKVYLNLEIFDLELAQPVDKASVGCYVSVGDRLHDVVVFSNVSGPLQIPIASPKETLRLTVKLLGADEVSYGTHRKPNFSFRRQCELHRRSLPRPRWPALPPLGHDFRERAGRRVRRRVRRAGRGYAAHSSRLHGERQEIHVRATIACT